MKCWCACALLLAANGCGSSPETHYYRLAIAVLEKAHEPRAGVLAVEAFSADAVYGDERMVYRSSPFRLDYDFYHRWTSPPPVQLSDVLRDAYAQTGLFQRVVSGVDGASDALLSGRVMAFDEVDESPESWVGRLDLELDLEEARSGLPLWSQRFQQSEPIRTRTPEGVAVALSAIVQRVVRESAFSIADAMHARANTPPYAPDAGL